jgi:hypothetical protein
MKNFKLKKKIQPEKVEDKLIKKVKKRDGLKLKVNYRSPKFWEGVYDDDDEPINLFGNDDDE